MLENFTSYSKNKNLSLKFFISTMLVFSLFDLAGANDVKLNTIEVIGNSEDVKNKKIGEIKKDSKALEKQQVSDTRDMVRYETGVSVVESGRFGASGYAIRGVDENRVAIQIDGLNQAETLSSQGFREIFEGYGNFNNTRDSVEIENIKQVNITKGADSIKAGSGALGGSVMFETKDARDFLIDKDWHYGFKVGHSSANDERMHSHTLAARIKWFDILAIKTDRDGHELKNYGYSKFDDNIRGREREKADPYDITKEGTLVKFGFSPHEEHRLSFTNDVYKAKSQGNDYSYTLYPTYITGFQPYSIEKRGERYTDDLSERINRSFAYENFTETLFWDNMKISYSHQKIKQRARTEEYCRDGENCANISNPIGLKLDGAKVVDKSGGNFTMAREQLAGEYTNFPTLTDSAGNKHRDFKLENINTYGIDCSVFDCSGTLNLYKLSGWGVGPAETLNLDLSNTEYITSDGRYKFNIAENQVNGKTYKTITQSSYNNFLGDWRTSSQSDQYKLVLPNSRGFLPRDWRERDLNTQTKQLNLDFEKEFSVFNIEHSLKYGANYAKIEKSMTNRGGYDATNPQWWANTYPIDCKNATNIYSEELRCPYVAPETSFLIPVESKNGALYLSDSITINDYIGLDIAYRYDKIKYNPVYTPGVTPAIPDDMVRGLFIPLATNPLTEPSWRDYANWSDYVAARDAYNAKQAEVDAQNATNAQRNIEYFSKPKEFKDNSYALGINLDPFDFLRIQAKYSKAFRAPTADELYLTFKHPDITIKPNVDLVAEIAKTKELAVTFHNNLSFATFSVFKTDYTNFLDFKFIERTRLNASANSMLDFDIWQNVNRAKAEASGFEINSHLNLSDISEIFSGFHIGYKLTKQKGEILTDADGKVPMNAIQPQTSVYNIGYATKSQKYGLDLYITDVKAKRSKDTYNMFWQNETGEIINSKVVDNYRSHWLSDKYHTFDIIAFARPIKNLTFRLGVYNLTDERYLTWENARSIRSFGTTNMVRRSDGLGINRFYSPGRNFKLTFEMTF